MVFKIHLNHWVHWLFEHPVFTVGTLGGYNDPFSWPSLGFVSLWLPPKKCEGEDHFFI